MTVSKQESEEEELQGDDIEVERSTTNKTFGGTASVVDRNSSPPEDELACAGDMKDNIDIAVTIFSIVFSSSLPHLTTATHHHLNHG